MIFGPAQPGQKIILKKIPARPEFIFKKPVPGRVHSILLNIY